MDGFWASGTLGWIKSGIFVVNKNGAERSSFGTSQARLGSVVYIAPNPIDSERTYPLLKVWTPPHG